MIRRALPYDVPRLVELGALMHAESPRFRGHPYMPERVARTVEQVMTMAAGLVLVAEQPGPGVVGVMVGIAAPHFACDFMQASDLALFVHPEHRGARHVVGLVKGYVEWARSIGAEPNIGLNTGVEPERTSSLLSALKAENTGSIWTWR
jgi:hypothetical protein